MARRPLDGVPRITQVYGNPSSLYRKGYHTGVDYGVPTGTPVRSPSNGTIHQVGDGRAKSDGRGYYMIIKGDDGVYHNLYHLLRWHVGSGRVTEGQHVADSDNTGLSTGAHLHWETRRGNNSQDFNPADWLFATPAPTPPPATGGTEVFKTDAEIKEFYNMLRGNKPVRAEEIAGWRGKSMLEFVLKAKPEVANRETRTNTLEGQVGNLTGQIDNLNKSVADLSKRPTQAQLDALKATADTATAQAERDRAEAERLKKALEAAQEHSGVTEEQAVKGWFSRLIDKVFAWNKE